MLRKDYAVLLQLPWHLLTPTEPNGVNPPSSICEVFESSVARILDAKLYFHGIVTPLAIRLNLVISLRSEVSRHGIKGDFLNLTE